MDFINSEIKYLYTILLKGKQKKGIQKASATSI